MSLGQTQAPWLVVVIGGTRLKGNIPAAAGYTGRGNVDWLRALMRGRLEQPMIGWPTAITLPSSGTTINGTQGIEPWTAVMPATTCALGVTTATGLGTEFLIPAINDTMALVRAKYPSRSVLVVLHPYEDDLAKNFAGTPGSNYSPIGSHDYLHAWDRVVAAVNAVKAWGAQPLLCTPIPSYYNGFDAEANFDWAPSAEVAAQRTAYVWEAVRRIEALGREDRSVWVCDQTRPLVDPESAYAIPRRYDNTPTTVTSAVLADLVGNAGEVASLTHIGATYSGVPNAIGAVILGKALRDAVLPRLEHLPTQRRRVASEGEVLTLNPSMGGRVAPSGTSVDAAGRIPTGWGAALSLTNPISAGDMTSTMQQDTYLRQYADLNFNPTWSSGNAVNTDGPGLLTSIGPLGEPPPGTWCKTVADIEYPIGGGVVGARVPFVRTRVASGTFLNAIAFAAADPSICPLLAGERMVIESPPFAWLQGTYDRITPYAQTYLDNAVAAANVDMRIHYLATELAEA